MTAGERALWETVTIGIGEAVFLTQKRKALIMDLGQNQKAIPRKPRETGAFALNENI